MERNVQYQTDFYPILSLAASPLEEFIVNIDYLYQKKKLQGDIPAEDNLRVYLEDLENGYLFRIMNNEENSKKTIKVPKGHIEVSLSGVKRRKDMEEEKMIWEKEKKNVQVNEENDECNEKSK